MANNNRHDFLTKTGYELGEKLDSGAQGEVFKAKKNGEDLAVKVINMGGKDKTKSELADDWTDLQRELVIMRTVKHENIINVMDIKQSSHKIYIFMEFASGGSLGSHVKKNGPLPEWYAKILFMPIVRALKHLHELNIAHRDLKLDNILLDQHGRPKLSDFGLSRYVEHQGDLVSTEAGTVSFMPPEMLKHLRYDPMIADIWSLGVCLYCMLYKVYPFDRHGHMQKTKKMIDDQMARRYTFPPQIKISSKAKDLIRKQLEPKIAKRIKLDEILKHPWAPRKPSNKYIQLSSLASNLKK